MSRAKRSVAKRARHRKWIKRAKGYRGSRSRVFKRAKEAVLKAGQHAYHDRRKKKNIKRGQWQTHLGAATRQHGLSYSLFIHSLRQTNIELNRKVLAQLASEQPAIFKEVIESAKKE